MSTSPKPSGLPLRLSRYLTPCRTSGLKRRTSSPLQATGKKTVSLNGLAGLATPLRRPANVEHADTPPKRPPDVDNDAMKKSPRLEPADPVQSENRNTKQKSQQNEVTPKCPSENEQLPFVGFCNPQDIIELIQGINSTEKKLTQKSEQSLIYRKQHNVKNLKEATELWKTAIKEATLEIQETIKSRQVDVSLASILKEHNIPFEDVEFSEELMDFE